MGEVSRVLFNKKLICIAAVLLCIQSAVLLYAGSGQICETGSVSSLTDDYLEEYEKLNAAWTGSGAEGAHELTEEWNEKISTSAQPYAFIRAVEILTEQFEALTEYEAYLAQVKHNCDTMRASVFNQNDYKQNEIAKTESDYALMEGAENTLDKELALRELVTEKSFTYSLLAIPCMICVIFSEERKKGLWRLLYSTYSYRRSFGLLHAGILLLGCAIPAALLSLWRIFLCAQIYGGYGDLSRSVQSFSLCKEVTVRASIGALIAFWAVWQVLAACFFGLMVWALTTAFGRIYVSAMVIALIGAFEYISFITYTDSSSLRILRYLNIFMLLEPRNIWFHYLNVNFLGRPIHVIKAFLIWYFVLAVVFACIGAVSQGMRRQVTEKRSLMAEMFAKKTNRIFARQGLFLQEGYKLLFAKKGLIILAALAILQIYAAEVPPAVSSSDQTVQEYFYKEYAGEMTHDKLAQMQEEYDDISKEIDKSDIAQRELLHQRQRVLGELVSLFDDELLNNDEVYVVPQNVYRAMLNPDNIENHTRLLAFENILVLCLLIPVIHSVENESNIKRLTASYYYGKGRRNRLFIYKLLWFAIYELIVFTTIYGRDIYLACKSYGLPQYAETAAYNMHFITEPIKGMSIRTLLLAVYLLRFAAALICGGFMCIIGSRSRSTRLAQGISLITIVIPGMLYLLGIELPIFSFIWRCICVAEWL